MFNKIIKYLNKKYYFMIDGKEYDSREFNYLTLNVTLDNTVPVEFKLTGVVKSEPSPENKILLLKKYSGKNGKAEKVKWAREISEAINDILDSLEEGIYIQSNKIYVNEWWHLKEDKIMINSKNIEIVKLNQYNNSEVIYIFKDSLVYKEIESRGYYEKLISNLRNRDVKFEIMKNPYSDEIKNGIRNQKEGNYE